MNDIKEKVKEIVANSLQIDEDKLTPEAEFSADLDVDSLDSINMIIDLEDALDIGISEEEVKKLVTFGELTEYIERKFEELQIGLGLY